MNLELPSTRVLPEDSRRSLLLFEQLQCAEHTKRLVCLDQVDAITNGALVVFDGLMQPQSVGEDLDSPGMTSIDQVFGENRPGDVDARMGAPCQP